MITRISTSLAAVAVATVAVLGCAGCDRGNAEKPWPATSTTSVLDRIPSSIGEPPTPSSAVTTTTPSAPSPATVAPAAGSYSTQTYQPGVDGPPLCNGACS